MTITIDSIWVLVGIGIVLGFGGYLGMYSAIALWKVSTWVGEKLGELILYIISFIKRRNITTQSPRYIWRYTILLLAVFWILTSLLIIYLVVWK
ncbi:hypothetical protein [Rahnella aquatilis]|uniref:hypothetical protein n=1 Tax=Rahnella aquatilis TaxID=34038 RepID=UPI00365958E4